MSITADVDRGLEIARMMKELKAELKEIEARLEKSGLNGPQIDLVDAEREGRQYLAHGSAQIVPVVFTADLIRKTFVEGSPAHVDMLATADGHLRDFYLPTRQWEGIFESGKALRARAAEVLGDDAPAFVTACVSRDKNGIPKSQVKVEWDRATESEVAA